jgi:hypothetical protein
VLALGAFVVFLILANNFKKIKKSSPIATFLTKSGLQNHNYYFKTMKKIKK